MAASATVTVQSRTFSYAPPPTPARTPEAELALLMRCLHRAGFDDGLAGHVTWAQGDGTMLVNPWELGWSEVRASDIGRADLEGNRLGGRYHITPALLIHVELRRRRPDLGIVLHNHPQWAGVWAGAGRVPPIYDQTSAQVPHELALVAEYDGEFGDLATAAQVADRVASYEWALLARHGVLITAPTIADAYLRGYTLEWRSKRAWHVEALGPTDALPAKLAKGFGDDFERHAAARWWDAASRIELAKDPGVLE